jgi:vacuolar-type H+-ATPase catalytic subunit A/Vma1
MHAECMRSSPFPLDSHAPRRWHLKTTRNQSTSSTMPWYDVNKTVCDNDLDAKLARMNSVGVVGVAPSKTPILTPVSSPVGIPTMGFIDVDIAEPRARSTPKPSTPKSSTESLFAREHRSQLRMRDKKIEELEKELASVHAKAAKVVERVLDKMRNDAGEKLCKRAFMRIVKGQKSSCVTSWRENKTAAKNHGRGERMMKRTMGRIRSRAQADALLCWQSKWREHTETVFREVMEDKVSTSTGKLSQLTKVFKDTAEVLCCCAQS